MKYKELISSTKKKRDIYEKLNALSYFLILGSFLGLLFSIYSFFITGIGVIISMLSTFKIRILEEKLRYYKSLKSV